MYAKPISLSFLILILGACSTGPTKRVQTKPKQALTKKTIYRPKVQKKTIYPGRVAVLNIDYRWENSDATLKCGEKRYPYYLDQNGQMIAYIAESYFSKRSEFSCSIELESQSVPVAKFSVLPFEFKKERLNVNKRRVVLSAPDLARVQKEQAILNEIYAASPSDPNFVEAFKAPLSSYITSYYGTKRVFNNKKQTQHLGTDFRAGVGVKIPAANRGRVVFVGNLFYTGNTVILDHGLKIFTVYAHLSKTQVKEGDLVNKKQIVGLAGATGRVTGPHLHWGVKINGDWIDGFSLVNHTRLTLKKK